MTSFVFKLMAYIPYFYIAFAFGLCYLALQLTSKTDLLKTTDSRDKIICAITLVMSSAGIFFLPSLFFIFSCGVPDWPTVLIPSAISLVLPGFIVSSIYSVAGFIFATAFIPVILIIFYEQIRASGPSMKYVAISLPCGIGGNLAGKALLSLAVMMAWQGGNEAKQESVLGILWLLGNAAVCVLVSMAMLRKE
jgi:hypothetical protein